METFGKFMTVVMALVVAPIISGFVLSKLWVWFIVTTFNIQPLRLAEAIGIMLLSNFLLAKKEKNKTPDEFWKSFIEHFLFVLLTAAFALFSGWVISLFI